MTRQDKLSQIGRMHLSAYTLKFIIPVPHKFYEHDDTTVFDNIRKSDWSIENESKGIKGKLGAFNIKAYIYNNMVPELNEESFFTDSRTLLLNKKFKDKKMKLTSLDQKEYSFFLRDIDLWVFEEHIAFFVLNIDFNDLIKFDDLSKYSIDELNEFNKVFRNFKFLKLTEQNDFINLEQTEIKYGEQYSFIKYLFELTEIPTLVNTTRGKEIVKKSFLKIDICDCTDLYKNEDINDLYSIYNTSANAKLLLGMQTSTAEYDEDGSAIEEYNEECMSFESVREMSILNEIPFYLATCAQFKEKKDWTANDEYIYQLVNEGGFNIWKYSTGLTIHDSSAFIGLSGDGGPVVNNVNGSFYFIYMLNLYINFQIRYLEHSLIDDDFESGDINYWYKKLQKLKNQFVSDDIGIKFQENELNRSMSSALKTQDILSEVSSNLVETKNITSSNMGIYITLIGFIFVSLLEEPIKNILLNYSEYVIPPVLFVCILIYKNRVKIRKKLKL